MNAIARIKAMLGLDTAEYEAGVKKAKSTTGGLSATLKNVGGLIAGAFSIGAIAAWGKSVVSTLASVSDLAVNLNVATESIAGLNIKAAAGGVKLDQLGNILTKLQGKQMDVAKGNKQAAKEFEDLGISVDQVISSDPIQLFELLAGKVDKSGVAVAQLGALLGDRLGGKTLEFIKSIASDGIPQITSETGAAIDEVSELMDKWAALKEEIKLITVRFVLSFEEARQKAIDKLSDNLAKFFINTGTSSPENKKARIAEIDRMAAAKKEMVDRGMTTKREELLRREERNEERKKQTTDALKDIAAATRLEQIDAEIEAANKQQSQSSRSSSGSFAQDSLRSIGGMVGRDLPSLPIIEKTLHVQESILQATLRLETLYQEKLAIEQGREWAGQ